MGRIFTHEQKLQYLRNGYVFVRSGKGTYKAYIATKTGVSRATYYRLTQEYADEAGIQIGRRAGTEIAGRCRRCDVAPQ